MACSFAYIADMNTAGSTRDLTLLGRFRQLLRALGTSALTLAGSPLPWAFCSSVSGSICSNPGPWRSWSIVSSGASPTLAWLPDGLQSWGQPAQLTAIVAAALALYLLHAAACAGHVYLSIGVGLRGLRRVRDDVSAGSSASRCAITTAPRQGTSSSGRDGHVRLSDPVPARVADLHQRHRHARVHGGGDGPAEPAPHRGGPGRGAGSWCCR